MDLTDNLPFSTGTLTHSFDITCSTGNVNVLSRFHEDIGFQITASTSTGTVTIPGGVTYSTSG